jgi:hypothetical protein
MSLINQALRKAQRDRSPNRMASPAERTAAPESAYTPSNGMPPGLVLGLVAGIALLIGLVAGLLVVVLQKDPAPIQQAIAPATQAVAVEAITRATALTQTVTRKQPSVLEELRIARQAAEAKAAAEAVAAEKAAAKPGQNIISWLSAATVSGIRLSDTGNKVILNNKSYVAGESVNYALGIKVLVIQEERILFIDANGKKYMKQL